MKEVESTGVKSLEFDSTLKLMPSKVRFPVLVSTSGEITESFE